MRIKAFAEDFDIDAFTTSKIQYLLLPRKSVKSRGDVFSLTHFPIDGLQCLQFSGCRRGRNIQVLGGGSCEREKNSTLERIRCKYCFFQKSRRPIFKKIPFHPPPWSGLR